MFDKSTEKPTESIKLTREEQLEAENLELRIALAQKEVERLVLTRIDIVRKIRDRTGISIDTPEWRMDILNGVVIPTT